MCPKSIHFSIAVLALFTALLLAACSDDDSFSPASRADTDQDLSSSSQGADSSRHSGLDPESSSSPGDGGSEAAMTSSSALQSARDSYFNPNIKYGTMTDPRDGKTYRTVNVEGKTWMAENLNYADSVNYLLLKGSSRCYGDDKEMCELYGRLYSRDAAMDDSRCEYQSGCDLGDGPIQGICPDGWHIPTLEEMDNLANFVGTDASRYKSMGSTWDYDEGVDTYGLSFLGAGNWDDKGGFDGLHRFEVVWAYWPNEYQHYLLIGGSPAPVRTMVNSEFEKYNSVRCIKDE